MESDVEAKVLWPRVLVVFDLREELDLLGSETKSDVPVPVSGPVGDAVEISRSREDDLSEGGDELGGVSAVESDFGAHLHTWSELPVRDVSLCEDRLWLGTRYLL